MLERGEGGKTGQLPGHGLQVLPLVFAARDLEGSHGHPTGMLICFSPRMPLACRSSIDSRPHQGSFLRTHSIESVVQFLLFERFIKTSSSKKVGNKNDNSSKAACHIVALLYIKKVISRFAGCSRWQSSGYWLRGRGSHCSNNKSKINRACDMILIGPDEALQ